MGEQHEINAICRHAILTASLHELFQCDNYFTLFSHEYQFSLLLLSCCETKIITRRWRNIAQILRCFVNGEIRCQGEGCAARLQVNFAMATFNSDKFLGDSVASLKIFSSQSKDFHGLYHKI